MLPEGTSSNIFTITNPAPQEKCLEGFRTSFPDKLPKKIASSPNDNRKPQEKFQTCQSSTKTPPIVQTINTPGARQPTYGSPQFPLKSTLQQSGQKGLFRCQYCENRLSRKREQTPSKHSRYPSTYNENTLFQTAHLNAESAPRAPLPTSPRSTQIVLTPQPKLHRSNSNIITTIAEIHENVESSSDESTNKIVTMWFCRTMALNSITFATPDKRSPNKAAILDPNHLAHSNSPRTLNSISSEPQQSIYLAPPNQNHPKPQQRR
ncbi:hypothetical protein NPIL_116541 [Nephila pilipes]|uniref:Uncharacterized protein n=1 Tax=Nephila pilipes TaxID=299642 RepID=A0A8X6IQT4_NEPPI|nr:hypothetical protein NPIL_116541 [Nephila pilipes]